MVSNRRCSFQCPLPKRLAHYTGNNLHWMMWEISRAVLLSLHTRRPLARSCLIWRANRYLREISRQTGGWDSARQP